jgi:hypothetical protein
MGCGVPGVGLPRNRYHESHRYLPPCCTATTLQRPNGTTDRTAASVQMEA